MTGLFARIATLTETTRTSKRRRRPTVGGRRRARLERLEPRQLLAGDVVNDLAELSDEFDDSATLAAWSRVHQSEGWNADQLRQWDIDQAQAGRMVMVPESVVWFQNWRGPLAFKEVTGDFAFTTEVHIADRDDVGGSDADDVPGDAQFSLGGVMIRTPRAITDPLTEWQPGSMADDGTNDGENYVFLSLGYGAGQNEFSLEVKTTRNSRSDLELTGLGQDASTIRVQTARIGDDVLTLYQLPGQEWQVHRRYSRPDLPATLQVGLVSYTDWQKASDFDPFYHNSNVLTAAGFDPTPDTPFNPDLVAGFEYARFERPDVPDELSGVDLVTQATDAQLLSFLGAHVDLPAGSDTTPQDADLVRVELHVLDDNGKPVSEIAVGDEFTIQLTVDDLREPGSGVFSAYVDVTYASDLAEPTGPISFGSDYPNAREGSLAAPGLIDEAGAVADALPLDGAAAVLFAVGMQATAEGTLVFALDEADLLPQHETSLYGESQPVSAEHFDLVSGSLTVVAANSAPIANDDEFTLFNSGQETTLDVLANDTTEVGESLSIAAISETDSGAAISIAAPGGIRYTPADGFYGSDSFTYTIDDGHGGTATAAVDVHVHKQWHNSEDPHDTNQNGFVSPLDGLLVINFLEDVGSIELPQPPGEHTSAPMLDVDNDGFVAPNDALGVINRLNDLAAERSAGNPAGEGPSLEHGDAVSRAPAARPASHLAPIELVDQALALWAPPVPDARLAQEEGEPLRFQLADLDDALDDLWFV